jgi:hypothetical protein
LPVVVLPVCGTVGSLVAVPAGDGPAGAGAVVVGISVVVDVADELVLGSVVLPLLPHPLITPTAVTAPAIPRSVVRP